MFLFPTLTTPAHHTNNKPIKAIVVIVLIFLMR